MDESQKHSAERMKPETKGHLLSDSHIYEMLEKSDFTYSDRKLTSAGLGVEGN